MRFRSIIRSVHTLYKLTASLSSLGKVAWVKFDDNLVRFTVIPDKGTQVWASLNIDQIFDAYTLQSAAASNAINLEVSLPLLHRALRSALNGTNVQIRLTKKANVPLLSLTMRTSTVASGLGGADGDRQRLRQRYRQNQNQTQSPSQAEIDADGEARQFDERDDGEDLLTERETVVTHDIPVAVLSPTEVEGLHEPRCREPDVHIILPSLAHLKSISDRFTRLALTTTSSLQTTTATSAHAARLKDDFSLSNAGMSSTSGTGGLASPRLVLAATMHGQLRVSLSTSQMSISTEWRALTNPALNATTLPGGAAAIDSHPSERMRRRTGEDAWARVRVDGRDWSRVLNVGRLGGRVVACFCHEHALILYVYLPSEDDIDESVMTYYVTSYSA